MAVREFREFTRRQLQLFSWWTDDSPAKDQDGIIAQGAVRTGKTSIMAMSFVMWAFANFNEQQFIWAGKSVGSFKRNVLTDLRKFVKARGMRWHYHKTDGVVTITKRSTGQRNYFYIFGGNDERSQDFVQGLTAAGAFFDEVALMPESFVNQAMARCSVKGSKFWFNCNPKGPMHWFKLNFIDMAVKKKLFVLHFVLDDNPGLDEETKERYRRMFKGQFYKRYILGLWTLAEGLIYNTFTDDMIVDATPEIFRYWVGVDYGHSNPTAFGLLGEGIDNRLYILDEYYHSGKNGEDEKSPSKYAEDFIEFIKKMPRSERVKIVNAIIDPSAKGFKIQLKERGFDRIKNAINDVLDGIFLMQLLISSDKFRVLRKCVNFIKEIYSYVWDEKAAEKGEDKPVKQFDHLMDMCRYVIMSERKYWERSVNYE